VPPSAEEYREVMEECLLWARITRSEKHRSALLRDSEDLARGCGAARTKPRAHCREPRDFPSV
jgi:PHD/YefM family antitoxin component YafN of YafNO toxin-antitoxin module